MKSLEEVIKYKLNFLPRGTDPFYTIQTYTYDERIGKYSRPMFLDFYETKNTIFSKDSFSLIEDITPLFIYISSCDTYYRENGYGKIAFMSITLDIPNVRGISNHDYSIIRTFSNYNTLDNRVFDDLVENKIAMFKKCLNESFSRKGYCVRYIEPFTIRIDVDFINFPAFFKHHKIFKLEECVICLEEEPKVLFCDCGHICICKKCIFLNIYNICPVCKERITLFRIIE